MQKQVLLDMLFQNQATCSFAFSQITEENAGLRLNEDTASVGFIYRHIGETMNMFGLFFGLPTEVQNTTMGQSDTGQGKDVEASRILIEKGYKVFQNYVENTPDSVWLEIVETPFFGNVSQSRLFGHVLFHNAHHAGQIALTLSRGRRKEES